MSLFTPVTGLIGGSLIGAGAGALLLLNGDIMGYSGIMSSAILHPIQTFEKNPWKFTFLASFSWAATVYMKYIHPTCLESSSSGGGPSKLAFVISGLLVGFGTKLGNGCTSGHGICGLARFSKRSLANVVSFMTTGILTTVAMSSLGEENNPLRSPEPNPIHSQYGMLFTLATILAALPNLSDTKTLGASLSGAISSFGLAISGMIDWKKIQGFLDISALWKDPSQYDATLACVMGSGVVVSWLSYQCVAKYSLAKDKNKCLTKPIMEDEFHVPTNTTIDAKLIAGGMIFGIGWAIGCFCPGPALFNVAAGSEGAMLYWMPSFVGGSYLAQNLVAALSSSNKTNTDSKKTS